VAAWYEETCRLLFYVLLSVTPSPKSTKFGSRYIVDGIWNIDRGGLLYIRANMCEL